jgi:tetrahydromethanopterin S-methyltransferase subunit B
MKKASNIAVWIGAVVAVAGLALGIMAYLGVIPTGISSEEIKYRINDIDERIDKIEVEIEEMKAQGNEVAELEIELSEAQLLNIEANHEWHYYDFDTAYEKVQDAEQKVVDLEERLAIPTPPRLTPTWVSVLVGLAAALLLLVIVSIFRKRRI